MNHTITDRNLKLLETARAALEAGELKQAALTLNKANQQDPSDPRVHMVGSWLAERSGNATGALESMQRAVRLSPEWTPGQLELALLHARQNQFGDAFAAADKAMQLEPTNLRVLAGAIDIAHRAGDLKRAVGLLERGLSLVPNDPQLRLLMASDLQALQRSGESMELWNGLLLEFPEQREARLGRLQAAIALNDLVTAAADAEWLVAQEPANETFRFYAALARGDTPPEQPSPLIQAIFDQAAETFDTRMVAGLGYRLPKLVADRLLADRPDKNFNVLDLGCGTGLLGVSLGRLQGALVGVELSSKMIEQAARHGVYDKFHTVNLHDALEATPDALYDVIAALDVFIYAGATDKAIPNALRVLVPGGQFVASFEETPDNLKDMVLQPSGRYTHNRLNVSDAFKQAGFAQIDVQEVTLRWEAGNPVKGFVIWGTKQK